MSSLYLPVVYDAALAVVPPPKKQNSEPIAMNSAASAIKIIYFLFVMS